MKKFMFSAVALIAFSFAGMANENLVKSQIEEEKTIKDYWDCAKIASDVYDELVDAFGEEEAMDNANAYFDDCMSSGESCNPPFVC
ncbi:hypothetical protein [Flavobacterium sp. J27]|uniref:hypothetical protein n=1 Tax=Flavobacterium sp. J27 TaxID=2060419 RepID=UPI00102FBAFB|nr:hypothetical protein [Flavobacterium sp. J27]